MSHDPLKSPDLSAVDPFVIDQKKPRVDFVTCPRCRGDGWIETGIDESMIGYGHTCYRCGGLGSIATDGGPT